MLTKKQQTWSHGLHDSHVHLDPSFVQHILRVSQESHGLSVYHQVPAGFYDILLPWLDLGDTWGIPHFWQAKSCSNFDHPLANTTAVVAKQLFSFFVHRCTQIGPRKHRAFGVHREEHIGQLRDTLW